MKHFQNVYKIRSIRNIGSIMFYYYMYTWSQEWKWKNKIWRKDYLLHFIFILYDVEYYDDIQLFHFHVLYVWGKHIKSCKRKTDVNSFKYFKAKLQLFPSQRDSSCSCLWCIGFISWKTNLPFNEEKEKKKLIIGSAASTNFKIKQRLRCAIKL